MCFNFSLFQGSFLELVVSVFCSLLWLFFLKKLLLATHSLFLDPFSIFAAFSQVLFISFLFESYHFPFLTFCLSLCPLTLILISEQTFKKISDSFLSSVTLSLSAANSDLCYFFHILHDFLYFEMLSCSFVLFVGMSFHHTFLVYDFFPVP